MVIYVGKINEISRAGTIIGYVWHYCTVNDFSTLLYSVYHAKGARENFDNINSMSSGVEELSASAEEISASASQLNSNTYSTVEEAKSGMRLLDRVVEQNLLIAQSMTEITDIAKRLLSSSGNIKGIIDMISVLPVKPICLL